MMCALMTPRVDDYFQKVHCDNADEPTMEGDGGGSIPEYLKYTFVSPQGKVYCSNVIDLYNFIRNGQSYEPYRRFAFTPEVRQDVLARYEWLQKVIEPHGLGRGILATIRDTALAAFTPGNIERSRLMTVWGKLHYPKYSIDEIMQADVATLNGIFAAINRQEGIQVTSHTKDRYFAAADANAKRKELIDIMYRIVNIDDPSGTHLVALEEAINDSTPQGTVRLRDEEDEMATEGALRAAPVPRVESELEWTRSSLPARRRRRHRPAFVVFPSVGISTGDDRSMDSIQELGRTAPDEFDRFAKSGELLRAADTL